MRILLTFFAVPLLAFPVFGETDGPISKTETDDSAFWVWEAVEDGSWNYRGRPTVHVKADKLFISYVTSYGATAIRSIDLGDGTRTTTVLSTPEAVDMHNNPSFTFDSQGRIVVFYGLVRGYSRHKQIARSVRPYDVSEFEVLHETFGSELTGNVGSQSGMWSDGKGMIFMQNYTVYDGARRELLFVSEDDGKRFGEHTLWSFALGDSYTDRSYTYTFFDAERRRLHFMALDKNMEIPMSYGLYYIYYDVESDRFYRANGDFAFDWSDTPIADGHQHMDVIADPASGHKRPFWSSINVDGDGNPYLSWSSRGGPNEEYWSRHDGERWRHYLVGERVGWRTGSYINARNPLEVFLPATIDSRTMQIQKRRFNEETETFVVAEYIGEAVPQRAWDPSGPPTSLPSDPEVFVWNYGRFSSQYGSDGYEGAIQVATNRPSPDSK